MRIVFLHQNFPGQFLPVATALRRADAHDLIAVIPRSNTRPTLIPTRTYDWLPAAAAAPGLAAN